MKIKPITFSFTVSIIISVFFLLVTFWIFHKYCGSTDAAAEALSTTGSYFGAVATLGAAIIAAYLFNDWRVQKKYELEKEYLEKLAFLLLEICKQVGSQGYKILHIYEKFDKDEQYAVLRLDKVDFLDIIEKEDTASYYVEFITKIIPGIRLSKNYEIFKECLTYLCFINEHIYRIYTEEIYNIDTASPFLTSYFREHQINDKQFKAYKQIIGNVSKNSVLNLSKNGKELTYSELLNEFDRAYNDLNSEIIKYINPST